MTHPNCDAGTAPATITTALLASALRRAAVAAQAVLDRRGEDDGTCNLDSPAIRLERWPEKKIQACAAEAGVGLDSFSWFGGRRWHFVSTPHGGQGNLRTRCAEAAGQSLANDLDGVAGVTTMMYYQMD